MCSYLVFLTTFVMHSVIRLPMYDLTKFLLSSYPVLTMLVPRFYYMHALSVPAMFLLCVLALCLLSSHGVLPDVQAMFLLRTFWLCLLHVRTYNTYMCMYVLTAVCMYASRCS
jgi:hypothetical protein